MISILMPIFNGIEFIDESVGSILNQTYTNWELLIGINGFSENSNEYQIAAKYENAQIKVFDFYNITGKSNTLNELIKYAKFDFIALMDVDDIWFNEKLTIQSTLLNKFDVLGTQCIWFGDRSGIIPSIPTGDISNFNFKLVNPIINSSSIIKKKLCYWISNDGLEDYELWLKLRKNGYTFFNFTDILVKHRIHSDSAFNSKNNTSKLLNILKNY
jgi:glycosyltransferase involved in cell wall biosynthesis